LARPSPSLSTLRRGDRSTRRKTRFRLLASLYGVGWITPRVPAKGFRSRFLLSQPIRTQERLSSAASRPGETVYPVGPGTAGQSAAPAGLLNLLLGEHEVHRPTPAGMVPAGPTVGQDVRVDTAGLLQSVGQHRQQVEGYVIVDGLGKF